MPYPICRYVKTNGVQCESPALTMDRFCYHHHRQLSRHRNFRPNPRLDPFFEPGRHIRLLPVEDRGSLQTALSQTVNAIATGQIALKEAKGILYGLNLSLQNIRDQEAHPELAPSTQTMVRELTYTSDHVDLAPRALTDDQDGDEERESALANAALKLNEPVPVDETQRRQAMHSIIESAF